MADNSQLSKNGDRSAKNRGASRRTVLKKSGMAGAFAALPVFNLQQSNRSKSDLHQGSKKVVDLKVNHPGAPDRIPRVSLATAVPNTYATEDRLFMLKVGPEDVGGAHDTLLRSPLNITGFSGQSGFQQSGTLYQDSDFDGKSATQLRPVDGYSPLNLDVEMEARTAVVSEGGEPILRVPAGSKETKELSERKVTVKKYGDPEEREIQRPGREGTRTVRPVLGTENGSVTPTLTVRNNGVLDMFGASGAAVVPDISGYPILGILKGNAASETVDVESVQKSDLFIVHRNYDHGPVFNQRGCTA
ncbi:MAG: hypothetical protein ABEJ42_06925 [Halobacteriaceae archaeon]